MESKQYATKQPIFSNFFTEETKDENKKYLETNENGNKKKAGIAIQSDEMELKIKTATRDKEGHYIMIK